MRVAFGLKAHSGWAALVGLGESDGGLVVVERRRVELVEKEWARQPYHAAEGLQPDAARKLVKQGIDAAYRIALGEMRTIVTEARGRKNEVAACAVLVGNRMPEWSVDQILAVHFRMHQAEGVLFRDALIYGARECGLKVLEIPEKTLSTYAEQTLNSPFAKLAAQITILGKLAGPPWTKDQKDATLAAMIALRA